MKEKPQEAVASQGFKITGSVCQFELDKKTF
jgi:hypothetical protein